MHESGSESTSEKGEKSDSGSGSGSGSGSERYVTIYSILCTAKPPRKKKIFIVLFFAVIVVLAHLDQGLVVDQDQKNLQQLTDHITANITVMLTLQNQIINQTSHMIHQMMTRHLNLGLEVVMVGLSLIFGKIIQIYTASGGQVGPEKNPIDSK